MLKIETIKAIVNISSFVDYDINNAFAEVKEFFTKHAPQSSCCIPGTFFSLCDMFELKKQYDQSQELIGQYKLGQLLTNDFLEKFFVVFPFLEKVSLDKKDIDKIIKNKASLMMMKDHTEEELTKNPKLAVKALLELAWTEAVIKIDKSKWEKITKEAEKVYLISNTNLMDLNKILFLLAEQLKFSEKIEKNELKNEKKENFYFKEEKIEILSKNNPQDEITSLLNVFKQERNSKQDIEITLALLRKKFPEMQMDISDEGCISITNTSPTIEIYTSCLCGTFKTKKENQSQHQNTTPPLVRLILDDLLLENNVPKEEIILVSQYEKDFEPAESRLPKENIKRAKDYFVEVQPLKCCIL